MKFTDRVSVGDIKQTREGYLVATARVARTGVQEYLAAELGDDAKSFRPTDVVRVYRPPEEVFADATLTSITRVPVTLDHPSEMVTADNWSKYAVGEVGDAYSKDGEWIVVNPMIKDAGAIRAAQTTHKEISMGYVADIVPARDGIDADFEMTNIRMNHLALVPKGRAGSKARIGDNAWGASPLIEDEPGLAPITKETVKMSDTLKTVVLGDKAVQVAVSDVAAIEQFKADSAKALADAKAAHDADIAAKDAEIAKKDAEITELKGKVLDAAALDAAVQVRADLIAKAKAIVADVKTDGVSDADIRKAVVTAKLGDEAKDKSDAYIDAYFDILAKDAAMPDPVRDTIAHLRPAGPAAVRDEAHKGYLDRMTRRDAAK